MSTRHHHPHAAGSRGWSIGFNGLTAAGQTELLRGLGRQLQANYQNVLKEPEPERIKHLLERLKRAQCERGEQS